MAGSNPIQPSICLFNRLSSNRVQAAFYTLCGKPWRNSRLLPLPWERVGVRASLGAGGGFGVGMAAIRHVLPLSFLFTFRIFLSAEGEIGCLRCPLQTGMNIKVQAAFEPSQKQPALCYFFIFINLNNLPGTTATRRSTLLPLPLRRTGGRRDSLIYGQGEARRNRRHKFLRA